MAEHNRKEADHAHEKCRCLQREKIDELDKLKISHKQALRSLQKFHSSQVQKEKNFVEKMWTEVLGHREIFSELLDEMKASQKLARQSKKDADADKRRATRTTR